MKTQIRVLLVIAILALFAGWLGLRRGNAELQQRMAAARAAGAAEVTR